MKGDRFEWEVVSLEDGIQQAGGSAPTLREAKSEAMRYAYLYSLDGPVRALIARLRAKVRTNMVDISIKQD